MNPTDWLATAVAFLLSATTPIFLKSMLARRGIVDAPNERSSHTEVAIRGMGIAPAIGVGGGMGLLILVAVPPSKDSQILAIILLGALAAAALGWVEDSRGLSVRNRAATQLAIGLVVSGLLLGASGTLMSHWLLIPLGAIGIAGYINVANFIDGINGISGLHGLVVGVAYATVGLVGDSRWLVPVGLVAAAAFLAFLPWNLAGGRLFLGDVGSYLLGGLIASIAIAAIVSGVPFLAVIGPISVYLADAGATLVRRAVTGEKWYQPHRTHAYQKLTDFGLSHLQVALCVSAVAAINAAIGVWSLVEPTMWILQSVVMLTICIAYWAGINCAWHSKFIASKSVTRGTCE